MANLFEIPVIYQGEELSFSAKVLSSGYTQKIEVDIFGEKVLFEPDEERNYRPVLSYTQLDNKYKLDLKLLKAMTEVFQVAIGIH